MSIANVLNTIPSHHNEILLVATKYRLIILVSLILFIIFVITLLARNMPRKTKANNALSNILLAFCTIISFCCIAEAICMFIPISHGVGYTLSARIWFDRYWKPINQFGFRDYKIDNAVNGKKKVFVMGDSIVAGHGIKNCEDRFSNILQEKLPKNFHVFNMGKNGLDTIGEITLLKTFPYKPDVLIISYFPNDIEERSSIGGIQFKGFMPYENLGPFLRFFVKESYFCNFLYWQLPQADCADYRNFLKASYTNEDVLNKHLEDLRYFIDYSKENHIPLYVVIFPLLTCDIPTWLKLLKPIEGFFSKNNIEFIKVSDLLQNIPCSKLIVNKNDAHPSKLVNRLVANELLNKLRENKELNIP